MIDLHSHLLPGVDDGARTLEQSVRVLGRMVEQGITDLCLTPHLETGRLEVGIPAAHDDAFHRLAPVAPEGIRLHRGVELMLDRPLPAAAAANRQLTLGGSRFLLVEFPPSVAAAAVRNALAHVAGTGLVPVLAHPERYRCCTPDEVAAWKATGSLMQLDGTTLFQTRTRGRRARALLAEGLADLIAADNHGDGRSVATAYAALCDHGGLAQAEQLIRANPAAILADAAPEPVAPLLIEESLVDRVRQLLRPEE